MIRTASCLLLALALPVMAGVTPLSWAPPKLTDPETILLGAQHRSLKLNKEKDYLIKLPEDKPFIGELNIYGGRNIVIVGGEIHIPSPEEDPSFAEHKRSRRAVYLKGQQGTVHIEGVLISGAGLKEGFNLDQRFPGCIVQLQNIRIEELSGSLSGNHADLMQTWAGPSELRIDRMTGFTTYQGFFMLPNQHFPVDKGGHLPTKWDFRRINILGTEKSAYLLWVPPGGTFPVVTKDVWVRPASKNTANRDQFLWPKPVQTNDKTWEGVQVGTPPDGEFVPKGSAGRGYVSPGYQKQP